MKIVLHSLCLIRALVSLGACVTAGMFKPMKSKRLTTGSGLSVQVRSKIECAGHCALNDNCFAANYNGKVCEIISSINRLPLPSDLVESPHWIYLNNTSERDECQSAPCMHGTCADGVNEYICTCYAGYQGTNCDEEINECLNSPCVHGSCADAVNGYTCTCNAGYEGIHCDGNINECLSSPCVHGSCNDVVNEYTCTCDAGYQGTNCDNLLQCSVEYDLIDGTTYSVGNSAFSASSEWSSGGYNFCDSCSRLDAALGWASRRAEVGVWIQVDLGDTRLVTAILSQGTGYYGEQEYVRHYTLATSLDDSLWTEVQDSDGDEVIFEANTAPDATVRNDMPEPLMARYVRLIVVSYNVHPTLRWEIKGCPLP